MRKFFVYQLVFAAAFFGSVQAMDQLSEQEEDLSLPLLNEDNATGKCIDFLTDALPTARVIMKGMNDTQALNVQSIAGFYDTANSTLWYSGLCGLERLVGTAYDQKSSLAPLASLLVMAGKYVPRLASAIEQFEPTGNNNNNGSSSSSASSASDLPVSNAAYQLRNFSLNDLIIDVMKENEKKVDPLLKAAHSFLEKNGDHIVSFLHNNRDDIKKYVGNAVLYSPVIVAGMSAAYEEYVKIKKRDEHDQILFRAFPDTLARREAEGRDEGMTDWIK